MTLSLSDMLAGAATPKGSPPVHNFVISLAQSAHERNKSHLGMVNRHGSAPHQLRLAPPAPLLQRYMPVAGKSLLSLPFNHVQGFALHCFTIR